jgi:hypothetical protein
MADFDEVPALSVVRDVSAKGRDVLSFTRNLDFETMEEFTLHGSFDDGFRRTWSGRFAECRAISERVIDMPFRPIDALSPLEIELWRGEMKVEFADALAHWANDPSHWMPLYGFLFPKNSQSFRSMNPAYYVKQLVIPGRFAIIDGDLDSGKSDHAMKMCQLIADLWEQHEKLGKDSDLTALMDELGTEVVDEDNPNARKLTLFESKGPRFVANIEVPKDSLHGKYFQFCTRLSDMIIQMARNAVDGYFSVLVLDEMGMTYNRKRVTSRHNFSLEGIFRLIRKFRASCIVITQNKELDLPDHLRRPDKGAKTTVEKLKKTEAIYTVYGVPQLFKQRVHGIPATTVTYDTQAVASLATDVDPRELVEEVELMRSQARAAGHPWDTNGMFTAMIQLCEQQQQMALKGGGGGMNMKRQQAMSMLQSLNPLTGDLFTPEEVVDELEVSEAFIDECQHVIAITGNPASSDVLTERVTALNKAKLPPEEISRLAGVPRSFVDKVLAALPKTTTAPAKKPPPKKAVPPPMVEEG